VSWNICDIFFFAREFRVCVPKKKPRQNSCLRAKTREREREKKFLKHNDTQVARSTPKRKTAASAFLLPTNTTPLRAALTRSIIQTPRWGEREEELVRLYRENFKPRGEETAFEIYRKRERENMSVLAKHATVNDDEDIRERAANGAVSTSGKGAGFARFFYRFFARGAAR